MTVMPFPLYALAAVNIHATAPIAHPPPRERTDEDRKRLAAAELKRARKNARRLGFVAKQWSRHDERARFWYRGELSVAVVNPLGEARYGWRIDSERGPIAVGHGDYATLDDAELAALRALPVAIEQVRGAGR